MFNLLRQDTPSERLLAHAEQWRPFRGRLAYLRSISPDLRRAIAILAPVAGILLFSSAVADATVDTRPALAAAIKRSRIDPRAERLARFFKKYSCPAPNYASEYLRVADQNELDYRLLPAISIRETQCGVHDTGNNWLGFHPDWSMKFPTPLDGLEFVGKRLAQHPFYKGKSLEKKLLMYNPYPKYPNEVIAIMREIEP